MGRANMAVMRQMTAATLTAPTSIMALGFWPQMGIPMRLAAKRSSPPAMTPRPTSMCHTVSESAAAFTVMSASPKRKATKGPAPRPEANFDLDPLTNPVQAARFAHRDVRCQDQQDAKCHMPRLQVPTCFHILPYSRPKSQFPRSQNPGRGRRRAEVY